MRAVGIILTLITIGTILGPIGAVVVIYRNDLSQLVIPPELHDLFDNDNNNFNPNDHFNNESISGDLSDSFNPRFISAEINKDTQTCTIKFEITNNAGYDLTLNSLNADIEVTQDYYPAGTISLTNPVSINSGQTALITLTGYWSQEAKAYIKNNYPDASSVELYATNLVINVNGMTIQPGGVMGLGSIPVNVEE